MCWFQINICCIIALSNLLNWRDSGSPQVSIQQPWSLEQSCNVNKITTGSRYVQVKFKSTPMRHCTLSSSVFKTPKILLTIHPLRYHWNPRPTYSWVHNFWATLGNTHILYWIVLASQNFCFDSMFDIWHTHFVYNINGVKKLFWSFWTLLNDFNILYFETNFSFKF